MDLLGQLNDLGAREITFIGGEAYLYPHWLEVISACAKLGIRPTMTTGARNLDLDTCRAMKEAGMSGVSISVDGLEQTHDELRAVKGSFRSALQSFQNCKEVGIPVFANTQINRLNIDELSEVIGDAALKYFILKTDAKKNMLFNTEESIDFNGHTGPFIQYTYARIQSILKSAKKWNRVCHVDRTLLLEEKNLIQIIINYPNVINNSATNLNPSLLANYLYNLAKNYNHFYQKHRILGLENKIDMDFRITISEKVSILISCGMNLLGINVPQKM